MLATVFREGRWVMAQEASDLGYIVQCPMPATCPHSWEVVVR